MRDPINFGKQWREVRNDLGVAQVNSHSFRKTIALGHSNVSMTQPPNFE